MSKADWKYLEISQKILKQGYWDTKEKVRPNWPDGTPAHTVKLFGVNVNYNLQEEFPITALRYTNWKGAIDEILWIWQRKSNNINDLNAHIWDQWADEKGSIGKAYGYQVGKKRKFKEGEFDQIDRIIWTLKNNPADRANIAELFNIDELAEMNLRPCVHHMQLDVTGDTLNMFLKQRSNDTLAAGNWNVVQYAALLEMLAQVSNLKPGVMQHEIVNAHIYDRHIPFFIELTLGRLDEIQNRLNKFNLEQTPEQNDYINKILNSDESKTRYENIINSIDELSKLFSDGINFKPMIEEAKYYESHPTDYYELCQRFVNSKAFQLADNVIELMQKCPDIEKALGFSTPQLELDKNVKDFYKFESPKMRNQNGKIVDNPKSSFQMSNYHPEKEGIKLQEKVPVAE